MNKSKVSDVVENINSVGYRDSIPKQEFIEVEYIDNALVNVSEIADVSMPFLPILFLPMFFFPFSFF